MSNIFEDFYYKRLGCREMQPKDEEYRKCRKEYDEAHDKLEETLNEEQKKLLDNLFWGHAGLMAILEYLSYKEGFRVALQLAFEMLR